MASSFCYPVNDSLKLFTQLLSYYNKKYSNKEAVINLFREDLDAKPLK